MIIDVSVQGSQFVPTKRVLIISQPPDTAETH